jgi:hypothetical protein
MAVCVKLGPKDSRKPLAKSGTKLQIISKQTLQGRGQPLVTGKLAPSSSCKSSAKTKAKSIAVATTLGQHIPNPRLLGPQQAPVQHSYSL